VKFLDLTDTVVMSARCACIIDEMSDGAKQRGRIQEVKPRFGIAQTKDVFRIHCSDLKRSCTKQVHKFLCRLQIWEMD
jgi:hypothetical protein